MEPCLFFERQRLWSLGEVTVAGKRSRWKKKKVGKEDGGRRPTIDRVKRHQGHQEHQGKRSP
jgi:hypothetical protein